MLSLPHTLDKEHFRAVNAKVFWGRTTDVLDKKAL
jgi:hypothetical protein